MLKDLTQKIAILYRAAFDPRSPWLLKWLLLFIVAYLLSPIDLIPDFIPVLGLLDELILIPLLLQMAYRLIPPTVMEELRASQSALEDSRQAGLEKLGRCIVILLWALMTIVFVIGFLYFT